MLRCKNRKACGLVLALLVIPSMPAAVLGDPASGPSGAPGTQAASRGESQPRFWLEARPLIRQGFIASSLIGATRDLDGIQVGYGIRGQSDEWPGWSTLWASRLSGGRQVVTGVRGDINPWPLAWSWGGFGPLLGLGLEYRSQNPRAGFGGYLSLGAEFAIWSRWHWQVGLDIEHDFAVSSESRNQIAFTVAYAHDRLTAGPDHD